MMATAPSDLRQARRALREAQNYLRSLIVTVEQAIDFLDKEMKLPPSVERGQRIARVCNALELSKDRAKLFGLPRREAKAKAKLKGGN